MPARFKFTVSSLEGCHPCCGESCVIATSLFDDSTGFTTTGSVGSGLLTLDADELMTFDAAAATEDDGQILITFADTAASTATVRLLIAVVDASNYLFGEFAIAAGAGTIRVGKRVGGTDAYLSDPETITDTSTDLGNRHELAICWEPGEPVDVEEFNTGPLLPFEVVSSTGWSQPDNVLLDDGNVATYDLPANTISEGITVDWEGMIPPFPTGSTIDGIIVAFRGGHDLIGADVTASVELSIGGNSDTKGPTAVTSGSNVYSFGGAADDWGFGLLGEDVNGSPVGVSLSFDNNELVDGVQITVDVITINFYYTTQDREAGVLTFSLKNNGSGLYQCVKSRQARSAGLQAGLRAQAATWDFTEATFSYLVSVTLPQCPDCNCPESPEGDCSPPCCEPGDTPFADYVVDLGAGGWTDDNCGFCDTINGAYVVSQVFIGGCFWFHSEDVGACTCDTFVVSRINFWLTITDTGDGCKWRLQIYLTGTQGPTNTCVGSSASYESAALGGGDDCTTMPVTLNKVTDVAGNTCNGALPAAITLDSA